MKLIVTPNVYVISPAKCFITLFLLLTTLTSVSQNTNWPPNGWEDSVIDIHLRGGWIELRTLQGHIVLKNGDTLGGLIRPWDGSCEFLEKGNFKEVVIPNDKIDLVQANVKSLGRDSLLIKNIKKNNHLWRLVNQKQEISIYDLPNYLKLSSFGIIMVLVEGKKSIKIYGSLFWPVRKNKSQLILKFINKRYNKQFATSDFKTDLDMIDYILNEENKREQKKV